MIYLTNDELDQAVYLDLRGTAPRARRAGTKNFFYGLLGNGVNEVPVTVKRSRDSTEVIFGRSELFRFVEETTIRRMIDEIVRELPLH